jgi:hypothetical protein
MTYKILTSHGPSELTNKVNEHIEQGWEVVGSHIVVTRKSLNRFHGSQHIDTIFDLEYSQTMIKRTLQSD